MFENIGKKQFYSEF